MNETQQLMITWAEDEPSVETTLINLLATVGSSHLNNSVVINLNLNLNKILLDWGLIQNDPIGKAIKWRLNSKLPFFSKKDFLGFYREIIKKKKENLLSGKDIILLGSEKELPLNMKFGLDFLVFIKSTDMAKSFLFKFIKNSDPDSNFHLVFSGRKNIEEAAQDFLQIKEELSATIKMKLNLSFAGFFFIDEDKQLLSTEVNTPLIKLFSGESAHGQILFILNKISRESKKRDVEGFLKDFVTKI